ncbi:MAG: M20/M25/M40 family metallo-hydrolase [Propionibacteriaceae bacterium]|nr:M20/M25/M40 family metallo-hydrolase [Propionibacteriaceae bacterium]
MNLSEHILADLSRLVAIPSVGALPDHASHLRSTADLVAEMLTAVGCPDVQVLDQPWAPAVIGRFPAPEGAPTICLYAHHDVQPIGDPEQWTYPPLEVTQVGDRVFGRGTSDDKGAIAIHLATLRAFDGHPPVGVTVFVEGEEEIGSPHSEEFLAAHSDLIRADAFVILDAGNTAVGQPAFTVSLRGVCDAIVEVQTLDHGVHSGQYGGLVPDALMALSRLLVSLHTDAGDVAIEGLRMAPPFNVDYPSESLLESSGLLDGVQQVGTGSVTDRLWAKPSLSIIGMDTVSVEQSSNTLLPSARARVSVRVPPGMTAHEALDALEAHLMTHAPWGAHVKVIRGGMGNPGQVPADGPLVLQGLAAYQQAFSVPAVLVGMGGAIPLVGELHQLFPDAEFLVTGIADPDSRMHAPDESVSLSDLVRTAQAQIGFLAAVGRS